MEDHMHPWRRLFARFIDYILFVNLLYLFAVLCAFYVLGIDVREMWLFESEFRFGLFAIFLWVFVEAFLLATWGTTPGKALYKIRLETQEGDITFWKALRRSLSVWYRGTAFGLPPIFIFPMYFAYKRLERDGATTWDQRGGFFISHGTISIPRWICIIAFLLFPCLFLVFGVVLLAFLISLFV